MANDDRFRKNADPTQSGRNGFIATPSDENELPAISRQLMIMEEGNLGFVFAGYDGEPVPTIANKIVLPIPVKAGQVFNYAVRFITEETTATVLVAY